MSRKDSLLDEPSMLASNHASLVSSEVESVFLQRCKRPSHFPSERVQIVECDNVAKLGKLVCLRFLEYVVQHPNGVIALPTGRTPESFLAWLAHYKSTWSTADTRADLAACGITVKNFPATSGLHLVQLDEFFPLPTSHKRSFTNYIRALYLPILEVDSSRLIDMDFAAGGVFSDLSDSDDPIVLFGTGADLMDALQHFDKPTDVPLLRKRRRVAEKLQKFAERFESRVIDLGGIGFFLGGIGPEGHVAFNMPSEDADWAQSKTRIVWLNYPSAAAAASDLGGIEYSRGKAALTIGLGTITYRADAVIVIMAAGASKAGVVAAAIEQPPAPRNPASAIQKMPGARFYVTTSAASQLKERRTWGFRNRLQHGQLRQEEEDEALIEAALSQSIRLTELTTEILQQHAHARVLLEKYQIPVMMRQAILTATRRLEEKIERGLKIAEAEHICHTSPHHDDIVLSYRAIFDSQFCRNNTHRFVYLTSGHHSVTDNYILCRLQQADPAFIRAHFAAIFQEPDAKIIKAFTAAHLDPKGPQRSRESEIETILLCRIIARESQACSAESLNAEVRRLTRVVLGQSPGDALPVDVQFLKGSIRETEADRVWGLLGLHPESVCHLRSKFYNDDLFQPLPTIEDDAMPLLRVLRDFGPDVVTCAADPQGTGPDTHYKVMQVVAQALDMLRKEGMTPRVWGYRNVWYHFTVSEATVMVPVRQQKLDEMDDCFMTCFSTQKAASFPSPEHDGPFSQWCMLRQQNQRMQVGTLLGEDWFREHSDERVQSCAGLVFLLEMDVETFIGSAAELKSVVELDRQSV